MSVKDLYTIIKDSPILVYPPINPVFDKINGQKLEMLLNDLDQTPVEPRKAILYMHIPFCKTRCTFCTYDSLIAKEGEPIIQSYLDSLYREIDSYSQKKYVQNIDFECVFIGGGTPSMLTDQQLDGLLKKIRESFNLNNVNEFTVEFELRTMTEKKIEVCREDGVTRISFGWQTFAPHVRKISALILKEEELRDKIKLLQNYRYSINADLIYGLPNQTFDDWKVDIEKAVDFGFTGMDLFKCENVPPAPMFELSKKLDWKFLDRETKKDMFVYAINTLKAKGYIQDSYQHVYHPSEPTSSHTYNTYLMRSSHDVLACGPSSYGFLANWLYINKWGIHEYISEGENRHNVGNMDCAYKLNKEDLRERDLVQGLTRGMSIPKKLLGMSISEEHNAIIDKLKKHQLLIETADRYQLTNEANGYVFNIAYEFMSKINRKKAFTFFMKHRSAIK